MHQTGGHTLDICYSLNAKNVVPIVQPVRCSKPNDIRQRNLLFAVDELTSHGHNELSLYGNKMITKTHKSMILPCQILQGGRKKKSRNSSIVR